MGTSDDRRQSQQHLCLNDQQEKNEFKNPQNDLYKMENFI